MTLSAQQISVNMWTVFEGMHKSLMGSQSEYFEGESPQLHQSKCKVE
jgi:hypothetical protein